jgi:hypothetical protein
MAIHIGGFMNKRNLAIVVMLLLGNACFAWAEYENVLVGNCAVANSNLKANFYVRNNDKHFSFEFMDPNGNVYEDTSAIHRQNIFTEEHGIKLAKGKVVIRETESYYKANFTYNTAKKTAEFKHAYSCIRDWFDQPCVTYVEKYRVEFNNCNLDFGNVLD